MSALLVPALYGPRRGEIIHLSIHLRAWKPFIMRPETSINYSDGRKSEEREAFERQIHLDLIGKQVCSRLLSRFPLRWSLRDNGAKEGRQTKKNDGEKESREDGKKCNENVQDERQKAKNKKLIEGPTGEWMTVFLCSLQPGDEQSQDEGIYWWRLKGQQRGLDLFSSSTNSHIMTLLLLSATHTSHPYLWMGVSASTWLYVQTDVTRQRWNSRCCQSEQLCSQSPVICHQSHKFMLIGLEKWLTQEFRCSEEKFWKKETDLKRAGRYIFQKFIYSGSTFFMSSVLI